MHLGRVITVCCYEPGELGVIEAGSEWLTSTVPNSRVPYDGNHD